MDEHLDELPMLPEQPTLNDVQQLNAKLNEAIAKLDRLLLLSGALPDAVLDEIAEQQRRVLPPRGRDQGGM